MLIKILPIFILALISTGLQAENIDLEKFHKEGHQMRMEHIEKTYQLRKQRLEESYQRQKETALAVHQIELSMKAGDEDGNKEKRQKIRQLRKAAKERQNNKNDELKALKQDFHKAMGERRRELKKEWKKQRSKD